MVKHEGVQRAQHTGQHIVNYIVNYIVRTIMQNIIATDRVDCRTRVIPTPAAKSSQIYVLL